MRMRLAERLGGGPRKHPRLMLSLWSLMHGTAMLMIRGGVSGILRTQMIYACLDALEAIVGEAARPKGKPSSGRRGPPALFRGEAVPTRAPQQEATPKPNSAKHPGGAGQKPPPGREYPGP